jgi:hypothetical protein
MRRHGVIPSCVVLLVALAASFGTSGALAAEGARLTATLSGAQEVPGPGDPNASGTAVVTINPGTKTVCYTLSWQNVDGTVTGGHIHVGEAGTAGGVVVSLFGAPLDDATSFPGTFTFSDCVTATVSAARLADIIDNAEGYYVNVHSTAFPDGAIRGQLTKRAED